MTDNREVAHYEDQGRAVAQSEAEQRVSQTLDMVREAMTNPGVDANKAKVMADLLNSQEDRWQRQQFNRDLNAAMMDMPVITKGGIIKIPANRDKGTAERIQGRFARFEDIDRVVRPILKRHNLAIRFEVGDLGNMVTVCPILSHGNGYTERGGAMRLPLDKSGAKNEVQGVGSAVSYGKRYTMCAALNIITEGTDDDGSLGKFNINMTHERQVTVLEEAECAHAEGRYSEWWTGLGVKDRAWMVNEGHHARLGAGTVLTDQTAGNRQAETASPTREAQAATAEPTRTATVKEEAQPKPQRTPLQWVEGYESELGKCTTTEILDEYIDGKRDALDRLKAGNPELHARAVQAGRDRRAAIDEGRLV